MLHKFLKDLEKIVRFRCYAVADDKDSPPGNFFGSGSSALRQRGNAGSTTMYKNLAGTLHLPFKNASVSPEHQLDILFTRVSPVGDADWAGAPIGSILIQTPIVSTAIAGAIVWLKVGSTAYEWVQMGGFASESYTDVTLTSAQVKALKATPIELVPAPGADLAVVPTAINIVCNYGGTNAFTETDDDFSIEYVGSSTELKEIEGTGLIDQTNDEWRYITFEFGETFIPNENEAIGITNLDDEFAGNAGGDNTVNIRTYYRIVPTDGYTNLY